jgi:hypothetical protein
MRLTDDELRDVLERAEEIQRTTRRGDELRGEMDAVIEAGEGIGLTRTAIERALRERFELAPPPAVGGRVFAKSADGKFHIAHVVAISGNDIRVNFVRGGEHVVTVDEIKPCSFVPGQRVMYHWPWWGPWNCEVISYHEPTQFLVLSDRWGSTTTCRAEDVWLEPQRQANARTPRQRAYATLIGVGTAVGAIVGSIITALLMR